MPGGDGLHAFFENDEVEELRGFPKVARREGFTSADRTYFTELNVCIVQAMETGHRNGVPRTWAALHRHD
jgi:hypothetical protein